METETLGDDEIEIDDFDCSKIISPIDKIIVKEEIFEEKPLAKLKYVCEYCHKAFKSNAVVQRHVKEVHFKNKRVQCEVCSASFYRKLALESHMGNSHPDYVSVKQEKNDETLPW